MLVAAVIAEDDVDELPAFGPVLSNSLEVKRRPYSTEDTDHGIGERWRYLTLDQLAYCVRHYGQL